MLVDQRVIEHNIRILKNVEQRPVSACRSTMELPACKRLALKRGTTRIASHCFQEAELKWEELWWYNLLCSSLTVVKIVKYVLRFHGPHRVVRLKLPWMSVPQLGYEPWSQSLRSIPKSYFSAPADSATPFAPFFSSIPQALSQNERLLVGMCSPQILPAPLEHNLVGGFFPILKNISH